MDKEEKIQYWLDISLYDLETAIVMLKGKRFLYVGFMCHQVIEKVLKAYYLCVYEKNAPYTHDLSYLAQESLIYEDFSEDQKNFIDLLEPLNIESRYPKYKERLLKTLNYKKCKDIYNKTKEMYQWIKRKSLKRL
ncbi:HEPN domain-containing protein [Candidatus Magnetomoraceae bacterium gMMP-1]